MRARTPVCLLALLTMTACGTTRPPRDTDPATRPYLIERVDDTAIAQIYADGFDALTPRDRILCYHLAQAAIAGRDIYLDQRFAYDLELRDMLEEMFVHRQALQPKDAKEIDRYTKLFWVHNGIHHNLTTRKMPFHMSEEQFLAAAELARADGAKLPEVDRLRELYVVITDPDRFVSVTNKSPADGGDPLLESCNNLYVGVSMQDLEGFQEHYPLNSRLVKNADGTLTEEIYRAGDSAYGVTPGRYADQIETIIRHLVAAREYAPEPTREALKQLIRYYRTGSPDDWHDYNVLWVADDASNVDAINGFIEVYVDARGVKGSWESVVSFVDKQKTEAIEKLAANAQWFEDRMPWADEFRKPQVRGITARAISVVCETGDSGPITPIGINLPNDADIRQDYGSKSVNLGNVVEAYDRLSSGKSVQEFAWSEEEIARAKRWEGIDDVHTNLHEVIGHASGKIRPEIKNPAQILGTYYSTLEEARADLVGLYWIADPEMQELGLVADREGALAEYEAYARNVLVQLRRVPPGGKIEEDHMRNRQMIIHWLIANTDAIVVEHRDGKTYYRVTGIDAFQKGCGALLAEVMRIKATGDFKAGKALVDTYGTSVDPALHKEVLARLEKLDLPSVTGFVQPDLVPVVDGDGKIVDVQVQYPFDIADQMLRWDGRKAPLVVEQ